MSASFFHRLGAFVILVWLSVGLAACSSFVKGGDNRHNVPMPASLISALRNIDSAPGAPMVIRIFKQEEVLEVWKRAGNGQYRLLKTYEICAYSGDLGPKFREGDRQSPEGFYTISPGLMNPNSAYYLAFNIGFPNKFDRAHGRTGSHIMVHGDCKSVGCYAMTDAGIAEIYALARETFKGGNPSFQLQIFPFRMTTANLAQHAQSPHLDFWKNLKEGHDYFELTKTPPVWDVCERRYIFNPVASGPLDALGPCPPTVEHPALVAKLQADNAALADQAEAIRRAAERKAAEEEAIRQRGAAVNNFFSNIGTMLGGAPASAPDSQDGLPTPAGQRP